MCIRDRAITDVDGHFYIEVPNKQSVLNITYIGFKSKEIVVGNEINFNIILEEDVEALDEVVVVGCLLYTSLFLYLAGS